MGHVVWQACVGFVVPLWARRRVMLFVVIWDGVRVVSERLLGVRVIVHVMFTDLCMSVVVIEHILVMSHWGIWSILVMAMIWVLLMQEVVISFRVRWSMIKLQNEISICYCGLTGNEKRAISLESPVVAGIPF
jgi:hypothetical protein